MANLSSDSCIGQLHFAKGWMPMPASLLPTTITWAKQKGKRKVEAMLLSSSLAVVQELATADILNVAPAPAGPCGLLLSPLFFVPLYWDRRDNGFLLFLASDGLTVLFGFSVFYHLGNHSP